MDVQGFRGANKTRNSAGDCRFYAGPEIQLEIAYSKAVRRYPKKYQIFFSAFRNNRSYKTRLGFSTWDTFRTSFRKCGAPISCQSGAFKGCHLGRKSINCFQKVKLMFKSWIMLSWSSRCLVRKSYGEKVGQEWDASAKCQVEMWKGKLLKTQMLVSFLQVHTQRKQTPS